ADRVRAEGRGRRRAAAEGSDRDRAVARRAVRSAGADQAVVRVVRRAPRGAGSNEGRGGAVRAVAVAHAQPPRVGPGAGGNGGDEDGTAAVVSCWVAQALRPAIAGLKPRASDG